MQRTGQSIWLKIVYLWNRLSEIETDKSSVESEIDWHWLTFMVWKNISHKLKFTNLWSLM